MNATTHPDGGSRSAGPLRPGADELLGALEETLAAYTALGGQRSVGPLLSQINYRFHQADQRDLETLRDALTICQARGYTFAAKALRSAILRFVRENDL